MNEFLLPDRISKHVVRIVFDKINAKLIKEQISSNAKGDGWTGGEVYSKQNGFSQLFQRQTMDEDANLNGINSIDFSCFQTMITESQLTVTADTGIFGDEYMGKGHVLIQSLIQPSYKEQVVVLSTDDMTHEAIMANRQLLK